MSLMKEFMIPMALLEMPMSGRFSAFGFFSAGAFSATAFFSSAGLSDAGFFSAGFLSALGAISRCDRKTRTKLQTQKRATGDEGNFVAWKRRMPKRGLGRSSPFWIRPFCRRLPSASFRPFLPFIFSLRVDRRFRSFGSSDRRSLIVVILWRRVFPFSDGLILADRSAACQDLWVFTVSERFSVYSVRGLGRGG
ncbi:hypothetical protein EJ110_NYTH35086 [Nymphaea thermarum]|nr:hypothetical protein EJ110_NYTH35086 [Nymphaea thermarum]